jgi:hypothetical protein
MTDAGPGASGQSGGSPEPGDKGSGGSPEPGGQGSGADKTYTQEQVDTFIAEEKRRASTKFGDYDAIKSKLAELEAAGQTELERAQAQAKDAESQAAQAVTQRNELLVRAAITSAAARAGALDPDVVVALLTNAIEVDAAGQVVGDVPALVGKLLEEKPYLKNGTPGVGSADQGAHSLRPGTASTPDQTMDTLFRR